MKHWLRLFGRRHTSTCEFSAGDEVVCIDLTSVGMPTPLQKDFVYVVEAVSQKLGASSLDGEISSFGLFLQGVKGHYGEGDFDHRRFRKVERRNWSEWLKTAEPSKYDKRKKVKA